MISDLKNKKVLVLGGTGFIGSRLVERLCLEEQAQVTVMVNSWSKATWVSRTNATLIQGNLFDEAKLEEIVADNEIVFHFVGLGGSYEEAMKINVHGTQNVLNACLKKGVKRIIYLSSVVVHGAEIPSDMDEEQAYLKTGNAYADSKIKAEKLVLNTINENEIEGVIIRPTFVWGPVSPYYTIDIIQQMKNKTFVLVDDGNGACNAVYIDNLIDLCLISSTHEQAKNQVFLACDGEKITWGRFYEYYAEMLSKKITDFKSIPLKSNFNRKFLLASKRMLEKHRLSLTSKINKRKSDKTFIVKFTLKAPRKVLKKMIFKIEKLQPEMDEWELKTYSSKGFISIKKTLKMLNYSPRISVEEGMKNSELWLRDQKFI
ncbi:MAG: NAD(P)-dependent oxidoreductase [Bacteroidota bacterium]